MTLFLRPYGNQALRAMETLYKERSSIRSSEFGVNGTCMLSAQYMY